MLFEYSYINSKGEIERETLEASDNQGATEKIMKDGKVPLEIKEIKVITKKTANKKIKKKELLIFTKHFSMIINSGIGLRDCFQILEEQEKGKLLKPIVTDLKESIDKGMSLSQSFSKYPGVFSQFYLSMLEISELSGTLKTCLSKLVVTIESDIKRSSQIKAALVYPAIISLVAVAVMVFMLVAIIPKFMVMFEGAGITMPTLTQSVINLSDALKNYWYLFISGILLFSYVFKMFLKVDRIKEIKDKYVLKVPLLGTFINYIIVSKILRNMSTLLASGISFSNTFEIVNKSIENRYFQILMKQAETSIIEGSAIASSFEEIKVFPVIVINMIKIGENTGKLVESLNNSFNFIEDEVENITKVLLTALEPIIILFISIGVGILVIAMYLPLFKMSEIVN